MKKEKLAEDLYLLTDETTKIGIAKDQDSYAWMAISVEGKLLKKFTSCYEAFSFYEVE